MRRTTVMLMAGLTILWWGNAASIRANSRITHPRLHVVSLPFARDIDVGGYHLHIDCVGKGQPTVILEAGAGMDSSVWTAVQPYVAMNIRVCSYDRAGEGQSDAGPRPRTSRRIVQELHTLLHRAGIDSPYVLVGHSIGGEYARMYAYTYPRAVVGMVLVDSAHEDEWLVLPVPDNTCTAGDTRCDEIKDSVSKLDAAEARAAVRGRGRFPLDHMPLVVLTAGRSHGDPAADAHWPAWQRALAHLSANSKQIILPNSGHLIQQDQPQAVIDAIHHVVTAIRHHATLS